MYSNNNDQKKYIKGILFAMAIAITVSSYATKEQFFNSSFYVSTNTKEQAISGTFSPTTIANPETVDPLPSTPHKMHGIPNMPDFTYAAKIATQTVVHIKATQKSKIIQQDFNHPLEQLFKEFFGEGFHMNPREYQKPAQESSGSGVLYTPNGYIITNNHVIEGADSIQITLNDNRCFDAKIIGTDPAVDLAVLKIEATHLPYLQVGNSDTIEVGEWVLAVGNPFNLNSTVTKGIVSAKSRTLGNREDKKLSIQSFIQTDAAINPGNSGGALVNLHGELIGINTAIYAARSSAFIGYGFAIPASLVKKVAEDLIQYGCVQRVVLGIKIINVTAALIKEKKLNLTKIEGVYVDSIQPTSPYVKLLTTGDVIIAINDKKVNQMSELQEIIACHKPGDKIMIKLYRNGKEKVVEVVLQKEPDAILIIEKNGSIQVEGAIFQELSPKVKAQLKLKEGVLVAEVLKGKFQTAGLKRGYILVSFDKQPIHNIPELTNIIRNTKGPVLLGIVTFNGGPIQYLAVDLS